MTLRFEDNNGCVTVVYDDNNYWGLVSQSPDDPRVENPGKWWASWPTRDIGLWGDGPFDTLKQAKDRIRQAYKENLTFDELLEARK